MDTGVLVRMANSIGDFFESMPDRPQAIKDIAEHIQKFWEPRMRRELFRHVDRGGDHGLKQIVLEAVTTYRARLAPADPKP